jgi:hypothetical protein
MSDAVLIALIASVAPTLVAVGTLILVIRNTQKVADLHVLINSNLTEWKAQNTRAAAAEGKANGIALGTAQERERSIEDHDRSAADRAEGRDGASRRTK